MSDYSNPNVEYMTKNLLELEESRHNFGVKHGFVYKRAQDFKKCVVIRWPLHKKYVTNYPRVDEYVKLCNDISDHYSLWDKNHILLDSDLRLLKAGIYSFVSWDFKLWAIPDDNKEVQDYVILRLPKWAKLTRKL